MSNKKKNIKASKIKDETNRIVKIYDSYQLALQFVMGAMEKAQDRIKLSQPH